MIKKIITKQELPPELEICRAEIISLKELHAIELQEVRCENEIAKADTEYKLKLATQKLKAFEHATSFADILAVYNDQMLQLEGTNATLINEIKRITKTSELS